MRYIKNKYIVDRKIHEDFYLIDISDNYSDDKCRLFEINEMGHVIWDMLDCLPDNESQVDMIVSKIKKMIIDDIPEDVIKIDVESFINSMIEEGFIRVG